MGKYVLLRIDDDREADDLLRDLAVAPYGVLETPLRHRVHVEVVPGLDAGDERKAIGCDDMDGLDLATAIGWSYERGPQLAAEWEEAS